MIWILTVANTTKPQHTKATLYDLCRNVNFNRMDPMTDVCVREPLIMWLKSIRGTQGGTVMKSVNCLCTAYTTSLIMPHNWIVTKRNLRNFRLPPQSRLDMRSSGILCIAQWWFLTDVSVKPIGPTFKGQEIQEEIRLGFLELWITDRQVVPKRRQIIPSTGRVISQKSAYLKKEFVISWNPTKR